MEFQMTSWSERNDRKEKRKKIKIKQRTKIKTERGREEGKKKNEECFKNKHSKTLLFTEQFGKFLVL